MEDKTKRNFYLINQSIFKNSLSVKIEIIFKNELENTQRRWRQKIFLHIFILDLFNYDLQKKIIKKIDNKKQFKVQHASFLPSLFFCCFRVIL
jgi:hypothetical protein